MFELKRCWMLSRCRPRV